MKCFDCPAYQWDAQHICLLEYPKVPDQLTELMCRGIELDTCNLYAEYKRATGN